MSWFLHLRLHLFFVAITFTIPTPSLTFDLGCREYERCLESIPDENIYRCNEIADAWKTIYTCLSKARCDDEYYGAGLVVGRCIQLRNYYHRINPQCGWSSLSPEFPDEHTLCGVNSIKAFQMNFHNDTIFRTCGELFLPYTCYDKKRMNHFVDCLWRASRNRFTDGLIRGTCEYWTDAKGRKCSYDQRTCNGSVTIKVGIGSMMLSVVVAIFFALMG